MAVRRSCLDLTTALLLATFLAAPAAGARPGSSHPAAATTPAPALPSTLWDSPQGVALHAAWKRAEYRFSPEVKAAYLVAAKAQALRELAAAGHTLPADFLAWVDGDPVVKATVYGARHAPAHVLVVLRSLELDLGRDEVRRKHTQLALAMAVVNAPCAERGEMGVSLQPRGLLKLEIPPCPLKPVDTHPKDRALDVNDHIINFFEGRTVEIEVKTTRIEDGKKVPALEKRTRAMAACDVMASAKLQEEFNAYMKEKGQAVEIHCGDHIIFPDRRDAIREPEGKEILKAFQLFKAAYEAKGLLPAARDPQPTLAETCAFLIRNDAQTLAPGVTAKWPRFPLTSPWPVLTYLAQNRQPLRECEDIWRRYHDKGEFHGYGEYIGGIAQQFAFQSARRLMPFPFAYGTFQMMLKDGGVCGTMANIRVRNDLALGVPSCTAGQPGHCALVTFAKAPKDDTFTLAGAQFATGGPEKTTPHAAWSFGDDTGRRPMIYPMTTAWAVNHGMQAFLDSSLAWCLWRSLPSSDRQAHGLTLLESGLAINPYNFLLVDAAQSQAETPRAQLAFEAFFTSLLAAENKPGCPKDGLYNQTVRGHLFRQLAIRPLPADPAEVAAVAAFLEKEKCDDAGAWLKYQTAIAGLPAIHAQVSADLKAAVAGQRTPQGCAVLAGRIGAVGATFKNRKDKQTWAEELLQTIIGQEDYLPAGAKRDAKTQQDPCAQVIFKLAGKDAEAKAREAALQRAQGEAANRDLSKDNQEK